MSAWNKLSKIFGAQHAPTQPGPQTSIARAEDLLNQGKAGEALELLGGLLRDEPENAAVLHLIGIAHAQTGKLLEARQLIERAISHAPTAPDYRTNLGNVLRLSGLADEAEIAYRSATAQAPLHLAGHIALARLLQSMDRLGEAATAYQSALALDPNAADLHVNYVHCLKSNNQALAALEHANKAIQLHPDNIDLLMQAAELELRQRKPVNAERLLRHILNINPDHAEANSNLSSALRLQASFAEAEFFARHAIALAPDLIGPIKNLISLFIDTNRIEDATSLIEMYAPDHPEDPDFWLFLAHLRTQRDERDEAIVLMRRVVAAKPDDDNSMLALAVILAARSETATEAESMYRRVIQLNPLRALTRLNLGMLLLQNGNYSEGWEAYEARWKTIDDPLTPSDLKAKFVHIKQRMQKLPEWKGESLVGKRLVVSREQGIGDSIMMLRYLPLLKSRGVTHLAYLANNNLERLINCIPAVDTVIQESEWQLQQSAQFDYYCSAMTLPYSFRTQLNNIPLPTPCLEIPQEMLEHWQRKLGGSIKPRIGLVWAGSPHLKNNKQRSLSFDDLESIMALKDFEFVSLQKGENHALTKQQSQSLIDHMDKCTDLLDTASLIQSLDMVITVDTGVAHLAGALGKPVWVFNRFGGEWRWLRDREDSPWYPSMRLFNQGDGESWGSVAQRVKQILPSVFPLNEDSQRQGTQRA
ncbi:MAG: repeat-containing protein [Rhodocyclales bacterium]|nr:repeat-containing protein [Rhodocyclales bacterium]